MQSCINLQLDRFSVPKYPRLPKLQSFFPRQSLQCNRLFSENSCHCSSQQNQSHGSTYNKPPSARSQRLSGPSNTCARRIPRAHHTSTQHCRLLCRKTSGNLHLGHLRDSRPALPNDLTWSSDETTWLAKFIDAIGRPDLSVLREESARQASVENVDEGLLGTVRWAQGKGCGNRGSCSTQMSEIHMMKMTWMKEYRSLFDKWRRQG